MKAFVAVFLVLAVVEAVTAASQEYFNNLKAATAKCAKQFNIEEGAVDDYIKNPKVPETENGKCMMACTMEELKGVVDGKLDVEAMKAGNKLKWDDPAIVAKADELVDMCNAEVSPDGKNKCDFVADIVSCFLRHSVAMNIPKPELTAVRR